MATKNDIELPASLIPEPAPRAVFALAALTREIQQQIKATVEMSDMAKAYLIAEAVLRTLDPIYAEFSGFVNKIKSSILPERFDQIGGMTGGSVRLLGYNVIATQKLQVYIRAEERADAFKWLEANGHGDLIKREPSVNAQTLASWARHELEEGRELPDDLFQQHFQRSTRVDKARK